MFEVRPPANLSAGDRLMAAPHSVRRHVLALLDELSAPLTARELERALVRSGEFTRSEARPVVRALKHLPIIAVGGGGAS